ncbi:glycosyltransferase family 10 [Marinomonas sp. FW-1]|uniref:glycosyltransferase family 10 domain-containing protein n=1 Tax=Marinomonas sp. FW-1 TaxID=2071621 RepID=UPI0010BFD69D|nr:glycosyltransferase family 10 [Marinomonas sp. FW-1]
MNKISLITQFGLDNTLFNIEGNIHNRDNFLYFYYRLRERFLEEGYDLSTCDLNSPDESDMILYMGLNQEISTHKQEEVFLLTLESPHVDSAIYRSEEHDKFKKIFTWNDQLVDGAKYIKVNYSYLFPENIANYPFDKRKLCCTIAGNKSSKHPEELYSERVKAIRWFEKYHPDEFDLYGTQWNEYLFGHSLLGRALNKIKFLQISKFPSYRGKVDSKKSVMQKYKFSICYENIKNQPGYITEKIFDSFFAGCVPIYWGANNISDHVPKTCFIDKRDFKDFESLYRYISEMSKDTFDRYLDSIDSFLKSEKSDQFRADYFANTIVNEMIEGVSR